MDIKVITAAILTENYSNDELNGVIEAIKYARTRLGKKKKSQFTIGASVKFRNSRTGQTVQGTVSKVGIKNIKVKSGMTLWTVPAVMLEPALNIGEYA
jgi:hypothetical protein